MSSAPLVCRSENTVLKRYSGTVTCDVWSSLGGTFTGGSRGLGKSMTSPATLFRMGYRDGKQGKRGRGSERPRRG